ncbi:MAG: ribonuclease HI family protein [Dehalococcoidia bacterium]|nr:ribonuclease HI family protein [Dehalococcoidia bacterium]
MEKSPKRLTVYVDGASRGNPGPAAIGVVIRDETGIALLKTSSSIGRATNNQAEYVALITGLREARRLGAEHVDIRTDSELMARQIGGSYRVRNAHIKPLFEELRQSLAAFRSYDVVHIPREQNYEADALANEALNRLRRS